MSIAVFAVTADLQPAAEILAQQLKLPFTRQYDAAYSYLLMLTPEYIGLQKMGDKSSPVYVDFASPKMQIRQQQASTRQEALARAFGIKKNHPAQVVDATAGLGRDSFILATLGVEVILLERSPIIYTLLQDGIARAHQQPALKLTMEKLQLRQTDAIAWLKNTKQADFIYLDPMFPLRKKSALVKKEMRFFHDIVEDKNDAEALIQTAIACATKRVVVKRPRLADFLAQCSPDFSLLGNSSRFDVYVKK